MLAFKSTFLNKSIWRIRHTEETHSVFEVGSEQLHYIKATLKKAVANLEITLRFLFLSHKIIQRRYNHNEKRNGKV